MADKSYRTAGIDRIRTLPPQGTVPVIRRELRPRIRTEPPSIVPLATTSFSNAEARPDEELKDFLYGLTWGLIVIIVLGFMLIAYLLAKRCKARKGKKESLIESGGSAQLQENQCSSSASNAYLSQYADLLDGDDFLMKHRVQEGSIKQIRKIGSGGFGVVWLVRFGDIKAASKRLNIDKAEPLGDDSTRKRLKSFIDEIKMSSQFKHPHIVALLGVAWSDYGLNLQALYEYVQRGNLRSWLKRQPTPALWTWQKTRIALDVCSALSYVHAFNPPVLHRDLKSSNILLTKNLRAKVCDFGLARCCTMTSTMTRGVGSTLWLAPEVILGKRHYNDRADVYSFGVLLSELDTHQLPYREIREMEGSVLGDLTIRSRVSAGELKPTFSSCCPPLIVEIARRCLSFNPEDRPPADEITQVLRSTLSD